MTQTCKRIRDRRLLARLNPQLFKALGDPMRIAILLRLLSCRREQSVSRVAACCPVDLSVVSRHLAVLRQAGVVCAAKAGKEVFYTVRVAELVSSLRALADAIENCCGTPQEEQANEQGR